MDGEIDTDELRSKLDEEAVRVVDIRSPGAFERGHIPGSENVPFPSLVDEVERFEGDDEVVTVCPKGKSSVQAARLIASYEVRWRRGKLRTRAERLGRTAGARERWRRDNVGQCDCRPRHRRRSCCTVLAAVWSRNGGSGKVHRHKGLSGGNISSSPPLSRTCPCGKSASVDDDANGRSDSMGARYDLLASCYSRNHWNKSGRAAC